MKRRAVQFFEDQLGFDQNACQDFIKLFGTEEIEILSLFSDGRINGQYVRSILVMLTEEQLGDKSNFKKKLGTFANEQHKDIDRQLFEDTKHALCF